MPLKVNKSATFSFPYVMRTRCVILLSVDEKIIVLATSTSIITDTPAEDTARLEECILCIVSRLLRELGKIGERTLHETR